MLLLRPFQKSALEGLKRPDSHVLCIAPTGSGKSLIYERRASVPGTRTLLVTPLIALARQQLERLRGAGIPATAAIGQIDGRGGPPKGESGAWIVSPESLQIPARRHALERWAPDFLVVDECHCLWEWGERFRPAFHALPTLLESGSIRRSLWLTATLPPHARHSLRECFSKLGLPLTELGSFSLPPDLALEARREPWPIRGEALLSSIEELRPLGPGLVFAQTREGCERLSRLLNSAGVMRTRVSAYHAGLSAEERRNVEATIRERKIETIVATSAFGMGMDYPHLRWVLLWQAPPSLLTLAQAIGRAGRSPGTPAIARVLWDVDDFPLIEWMAEGSSRKMKDLESVATFLSGGWHGDKRCRAALLEAFFNGPTDALGASLNAATDVTRCNRCDHCAENRVKFVAQSSHSSKGRPVR